MDINVKEPLYIHISGCDYIVRPGTIGVERNKVVYFWDVTKNAAVGFSRDFCLENPQMFNISRSLSDREVSLKDVFKVISDCGLTKRQMDELNQKLNSI